MNLYKNIHVRWLNLQSCCAITTKNFIFCNELLNILMFITMIFSFHRLMRIKYFMMATESINLIQLQKDNFNSSTEIE